MRRSRAVPIATLSAIALAFSACGEEETAYCVDDDNRVVDNSECDRVQNNPGGGFFWLFLAGNRFGGRAPAPGQRLPAGERIHPSNKAALQSKGGFGSNARSTGIGRTVSAGG
jgi:hypothetical protein